MLTCPTAAAAAAPSPPGAGAGAGTGCVGGGLRRHTGHQSASRRSIVSLVPSLHKTLLVSTPAAPAAVYIYNIRAICVYIHMCLCSEYINVHYTRIYIGA